MYRSLNRGSVSTKGYKHREVQKMLLRVFEVINTKLNYSTLCIMLIYAYIIACLVIESLVQGVIIIGQPSKLHKLSNNYN